MWQCISPKSLRRVLRSAVDETDDKLWNGSEEDGDVRSVRKTKAQNVMIKTLTLTGKGR